MNTLPITLAAWNAWEMGSTAPESWTHIDTAGNEQSHSTLTKAQRIPAMLRRRLGSLGKAAIASGEELIANIDESIPTVFCSQHGDLKRTLGLLDSLSKQEPLSPTQFSLSVHNAIAGIYSIARKDHSATTALSCMQDDVSTALLETQLILEEQQSQYALCIVHDEPVPARYSTSAQPKRAYAVSFLLCARPSSTAQQLHLSIGSKACVVRHESLPKLQPSALTLIDFLNGADKKELQLDTASHLWYWQKGKQAQTP